MIPQFTADASLSRSRASYVPARQAPGSNTAFVRQRMIVASARRVLPEDGGALEWGGVGTTITCPGCAQHSCGFLGLSSCLTCC
jgi:hypothetical protein